jgi:hypothetical protein
MDLWKLPSTLQLLTCPFELNVMLLHAASYPHHTMAATTINVTKICMETPGTLKHLMAADSYKEGPGEDTGRHNWLNLTDMKETLHSTVAGRPMEQRRVKLSGHK